MSRGRTYTLRNAASIVFALTAVIPLLLFTYTLYSLNDLRQTEAQMGLGAALVCALVGLFIFSNLMARLSEVLRYVEQRDAPAEAVSAPPAVSADADEGSAVRPLAMAGSEPAAAWPGPGG